MEQLAIPHQSECIAREPRKVRGGVGLHFSHKGAPYVVLSVHLKASCAAEDSHAPKGRPNLIDDCQTLAAQIGILAQWIHATTSKGITVIAAGDYNRKFMENNDRHASFLKQVDPNVRFEPQKKSMCWPVNYPQSKRFRTSKAYDAFGEIGIGDGKTARWSPYMPSSIGSRDFFVISGPNAQQLSSGDEILLRPDPIIHNPAPRDVPISHRKEIEDQAAEAGVRFGPPSGYLSTCDEPEVGKLPTPAPFKGSSTVLSFQNIYPSDHCPIVIDLK